MYRHEFSKAKGQEEPGTLFWLCLCLLLWLCKLFSFSGLQLLYLKWEIELSIKPLPHWTFYNFLLRGMLWKRHQQSGWGLPRQQEGGKVSHISLILKATWTEVADVFRVWNSKPEWVLYWQRPKHCLKGQGYERKIPGEKMRHMAVVREKDVCKWEGSRPIDFQKMSLINILETNISAKPCMWREKRIQRSCW